MTQCLSGWRWRSFLYGLWMFFNSLPIQWTYSTFLRFSYPVFFYRFVVSGLNLDKLCGICLILKLCTFKLTGVSKLPLRVSECVYVMHWWPVHNHEEVQHGSRICMDHNINSRVVGLNLFTMLLGLKSHSLTVVKHVGAQVSLNETYSTSCASRCLCCIITIRSSSKQQLPTLQGWYEHV